MNQKKFIVIKIISGISVVALFGFFSTALNAQPSFHEGAAYSSDNNSPPVEYKGMKLVWNDEFNNNGAPDSRNWGYEYGFVRNRELQWYQPQNAYCRDGRLIIEGKNEVVPNPNYNPLSGDWRASDSNARYTSACLITKGLHEWEPSGYFEIRARIDTTLGAWPAIWLLGTNDRWPHGGEIDVMEFYRINSIPTILANVAWGTEVEYTGNWSSTKKPLSGFVKMDPDWTKKFHTWAMSWDKNQIRIFLDEALIHETSLDETKNPNGSNPFRGDNKFYILLNLALGANGGDLSESDLPITFEVDYVRVYKNDQ